MKKLTLLFAFYFLLSAVSAQVNTDSLTYVVQRKKINTMLAQRAVKFEEYQQSLNAHSGLFGAQTKKDIKRSGDILMDVVTTDDSIYSAVKILMSYPVFKKNLSQMNSRSSDANKLAIIKNLKAEVDSLKAREELQPQDQENTTPLFIIIIVLSVLAIVLLLLGRKKNK